MRKESAGVTEALLKSAQLEFLTHGFHDASLRRISADSGVSTNSIYTRFGDKAGLFEALVKPAADGLMEIYMQEQLMSIFLISLLGLRKNIIRNLRRNMPRRGYISVISLFM